MALLRPGFDYGPGPTVVRLSIPQSPWVPSARRVGGHRVLAAGIPVARTIRRDRLLTLNLRVTETEFYQLLEPMVAWAQDQSGTGAQFRFRFDQDTAGVMVYLDAPMHDLTPGRGTFPGELTATLTLRRADGTAWNLDYYGYNG